MPFLQISLEQDLDEQEAWLALAYVREHFPLRQSEGRLYHMATDFLLIEQPEHDMLTFEQKLWLEQHQETAHIWYTRFYDTAADGCRLCGYPFQSLPAGYCQQCGAIDSSSMTRLKIRLAKGESDYLRHLQRQGRGDIRLLAVTFLDLFASGGITPKMLLATEADRFTENALAYFHTQQNTCFFCKLADEECTCLHSSFNYRRFNDPFDLASFTALPLLHQDARRLQTLANQHGLTVDSLVRILVEMPDLQRVVARQKASTEQGHVSDQQTQQERQ